MTTTARSGPDQSQEESGTPSPAFCVGKRSPEYLASWSAAAFPGTREGCWIRSGTASSQAGTPIQDACVAGGSLSCSVMVPDSGFCLSKTHNKRAFWLWDIIWSMYLKSCFYTTCLPWWHLQIHLKNTNNKYLISNQISKITHQGAAEWGPFLPQ